jgi:hypothetical protein
LLTRLMHRRTRDFIPNDNLHSKTKPEEPFFWRPRNASRIPSLRDIPSGSLPCRAGEPGQVETVPWDKSKINPDRLEGVTSPKIPAKTPPLH